MNRPFAESFLNRNDHVVLTRRLLPLSLWHLLNLEIAESPYFVGGKFPLIKDLRIAVTICTSKFPELPNFRNRRLIFDWVRSWNCKFLVETAKFRAYLDDYNALPMLWKEEQKPSAAGRQPVGLPWALGIVSSVCGSTGWSDECVWNMPVGQAYWYHVAFAMQKGCSVELVSDGELEAIDRLKKRKRKEQNG